MASTSVTRNRKRQSEQPYIPSLPDDIAMVVLSRVPPRSHALLTGVCHRWRDLVNSTALYEQRKKAGTTTHFLCLLQAAPQLNPKQPPVYNVSLLNEHNTWERLPPIPEYRQWGLPLFCRFAAVSGRLVVVGGWNPATWETLRSVYVFSFSSWRWERGTNMPSTRSFFACAAVGDYIFVAGGHDNTKMALASAERYDLKTDSWEVLPRMHELRDECMGAVLDEKFHAISGYHTATQCKYVKSAEVYDPVSRAWTRIEEMIHVSPGAIVGAAGCLFAIHDREILAYYSSANKWEVLDELPEGDDGISPPLCVTSYGRKLVVTGTCNVDEEKYRTFLYNLPTEISTFSESLKCKGIWEALPVDDQFLGMTQTSCVVEL